MIKSAKAESVYDEVTLDNDYIILRERHTAMNRHKVMVFGYS